MSGTENETAELLDADEVSKSINGFDQIAVRQMFRERLDQLAGDAAMFMRALLFVVERRGGANDADAFRAVMSLGLSDVYDRFADKEGPDVEPEDESAVAERDREYAEFVTACRLSFTVTQYMDLTLGQKTALLDAANRMRG